MRTDEWTHFGWQGIELDVPADWSLGKIEGDRVTGYMRLDDGEMARLEVKWSSTKKPDYDVESEVTRQIRAIEKKVRKAGQEFVLRRKVRLVRLRNRSWECFSLKSDMSSYGLLTCCHTCGRVILLQVLYREGEAGRALSKRIFESLSDHREDCMDYWGVYGVRLELPSNFVLERSTLKIGEIRLLFRRERDEMEAVRVSLGSYHLKEQGLLEWFMDFYGSEIRSFDARAAQIVVAGHAGYEFLGKIRLGRRLLKAFRRAFLLCRVWYCGESDKLFIFRGVLGQEDRSVFDQACASFLCH